MPQAEVVVSDNSGVNSPTEVQDVNPGTPSTPEGVEKPSFIDAVEAALKPTGKEVSPTSGEGEEQPKPDAKASEAGAEGDKAEAELTEDEIKSYPPNSQRRIRQLVAQRDDEKEQAARLKPRAENWDRVAAYMRDNSIQPGEFDNALAITSLINSGDYTKALEVLTPIYRELAARAGEILPNDLAEEVRLGRISEQHARELNRNRARAVSAEQRETRTRERQAYEQETGRVQVVVDTAVRAVDDWAKAKAGSDPDWSVKQEDVADQVKLELDRLGKAGFPQTKEAAIQIAEAALKKVEERIKRYRPKPEVKRAPNGTYASTTAKKKPATYMEAFEQALNG